MEIKQLALVLEQIDQIFVDDALLAATDRLIATLDEVVNGAAEPSTLTQPRAALLALHEKIDPVANAWTDEQMMLLDNYGGLNLIGRPAIDTINEAFVEHFMNPAAVLTTLQTLRNESEDLHHRTQSLLGDLDPALVNETIIIEEIVEGEYAVTDELGDERNVIQLIRDKLVPTDNVPPEVSNGMPAIPTRVKVMAAVPVALAVAGKAVDLYMRYGREKKPVSKPISSRSKRSNSGRVRYYSRQITVIRDE